MVDELRATCATPTELLFKIAEDMRAEMKSGLESIHESKLPMLPSYVDNLPDGYVHFPMCHTVYIRRRRSRNMGDSALNSF